MKGTSLNNTRSIKQGIIDKVIEQTPLELQPLHWQVQAFLKSPLSDRDRLNHYLSKAKYRNNYER